LRMKGRNEVLSTNFSGQNPIPIPKIMLESE
jgi:hypothetical protein